MIDTHVHLWKPTQLSYPWLNEEASLNREYLLNDLAQESDGAISEGFVFVQAGTAKTDFLSEAKWLQSLASESSPKILGIVAGASIEDGKGVRAHLEALSEISLVRGVRRLIQGEADDFFCSRPQFIEGLNCLPEFNFSFDICIYHRQLASVLKMVQACPDVHFILDHLGKPGVKDELLDPWKAQIKALSTFPNVACKISGLITEADHSHWTKASLNPYLEHVLDHFGPDRVMFGSDWPVINLAANYSQWLEILQEVIPRKDHAKFFQENARRVYRLGT